MRKDKQKQFIKQNGRQRRNSVQFFCSHKKRAANAYLSSLRIAILGAIFFFTRGHNVFFMNISTRYLAPAAPITGIILIPQEQHT